MGKWGENISDSVVEDEWRIKQIRGKKGKKNGDNRKERYLVSVGIFFFFLTFDLDG